MFSLSHAYKACHFILMMDTLRLTDVLSRLPSRIEETRGIHPDAKNP